MHKKVLVTGSKGQLGLSLQKLSGEYKQFDFTFTDKEELDISDKTQVINYVVNNQFDFIINCAAYTAVDAAETDVELADSINHLSVAILASVAKDTDAVFIHISTDYVFNGETHLPYKETNKVSPKNVYGKTKLDGELAFKTYNPKGCVIRTSWVYSEYGNNFLKTMIRLGTERDELGIIFDQIGTPTYALDLATSILSIISVPQNGSIFASNDFEQKLFHFSNEGVCSWFDFAKAIFEVTDIKCIVKPIETTDYPTAAARPQYSVLNKKKIKQTFNLSIPYWKDSLILCINNLQRN